jgi:predicted dehydrogenase
MTGQVPHSFRAGVVGPSGIGRVHIEALRACGVQVEAIASSSLESADRAGAELEVPRAYGTVAELVKSPSIDVVHVCSPNVLHSDHVRLALDAGKHVVCEKPLATSFAEATSLLDAARSAGRLHAVAYPFRFDALAAEMRSIVRGGELGRIHFVRGGYLLDDTLLLDPASWRFDPALRGPSLSLADIGVHWWDLLEHVTGEKITEAWCVTTTARELSTADDSAAVVLRLEGGAIAQATLSETAPGHRDDAGGFIDMEVIGTRASVAWRQRARDGLWFASLGTAGAIRPARPFGYAPEGNRLGFTNAYLDAFYRLIAEIYRGFYARAATYPTFVDGARGIGVLDALRESADSGQWTAVVGA